MKKFTYLGMVIVASLILSGCNTTEKQSKSDNFKTPPKIVVKTPLNFGTEQITLEQAMAHPDWIGRKPERAFWSWDNQTIIYSQKQQGTELRDQFSIKNGENPEKIKIADLHNVGASNAVYSQDKQYVAYTFKGNVFVRNILNGKLRQLTHSSSPVRSLLFLNNGKLSFRRANTFYAMNVKTGFTQELAKFVLKDKAKAIKEPSGYIHKEQHALLKYVEITHKNKINAYNRNNEVNKLNNTTADNQFYLGAKKRIVAASLSPQGNKFIVVITDKGSDRNKSDIMPNYISQDGNIDSVKVRSRVAAATPKSSDVIIIDLKSRKQTKLSFDALSGFDEDVLKDVKIENAKATGKSYKSERVPRHINLMSDWTWSQSPIQWNKKGTNVAIMLEAWDNKDRWIATVDFTKNNFVEQHRLHDKAWVNYAHNDFGWMNNNEEIYFLSEDSGYSQIYTKAIKNEANVKQRTNGQFVVSNLTLSRDDNFIYFKANIKHPGVYEIYRYNFTSDAIERLTDLNGVTDYKLSPNEQQLLLTHSKIMKPQELYITEAKTHSKATQLTKTITNDFLNKKLIAPKIVAVKSSHTSQPIYAKVYYPADYKEGETGKNRKAVIFNHGAGYLQNSHMGWSVYFREFMFHSLLASEGYVVMDMDYRASKGYGRDWRTAIYRHMGKPEIEDLQDGVNWMVQHANVDKDAIGTYGGSYGGFMTFMALFTQPDLFKSGAALRPVTDWAYYNSAYTANILNHPDIDPIAYKRSSPIYFAEGLQNHLLINAPMVDDNVFFHDVVRLVQKLIELEKENFETAIYPVEPHGFKQPSSWLDAYRRIHKLFKETL